MLLAEELALIAINPSTGRHAGGDRRILNATMAGLLIAELHIEGRATFQGTRSRPGATATDVTGPQLSQTLAAAEATLAHRGPKLKKVLRAMDRDLERQLGTGTWDSAVAALVATGKVSTPAGSLRPKVEVLDTGHRDLIIARLREAAAGNGQLDDRTAALLNATGPAHLLELVAPERRTRRHARRRIDKLLDGTALGTIGHLVRTVIKEDESNHGGATTTSATSST
ncbi:MAG: GPP34 family phosphoprotein [Acidimicrobiales bacterium]|nr:GPP34 family phosphoprotein [Acidimicrobiales bacterium]